MNIITVTKNRAMPGQYKLAIKRQGKPIPDYHYAHSTAEAAAKAMELAISCAGPYQIHGNEEVIEHINNKSINGDSGK